MAGANRILIVDDDVELQDLMRQFLAPQGFEIETAGDYTCGLRAATWGDSDLVVLDVMLPGGSGLDLLRELRMKSSVPVLLLTAHGDPIDRVVGLELGADDYLAKPFDPHELVSRIRAILRRSRSGSEVSESGDWIGAGELSLSLSLRSARLRGKELGLTAIEFNLLEYLVRHIGTIVSREQLSRDVLGRQVGLLDRSIDVHMSRVRRKIVQCGGDGDLIKAIRGCGYCYAAMRKAA